MVIIIQDLISMHREAGAGAVLGYTALYKALLQIRWSTCGQGHSLDRVRQRKGSPAEKGVLHRESSSGGWGGANLLFIISKYTVAVFRHTRRGGSDLITDGCEPPCGYWDLNSGPLEEQSVL